MSGKQESLFRAMNIQLHYYFQIFAMYFSAKIFKTQVPKVGNFQYSLILILKCKEAIKFTDLTEDESRLSKAYLIE